MIFEDLGIIDYKEAWDYQLEIFNNTITHKKENLPTKNYVLICEHPHVITMGRNADDKNLLYDVNFLDTKSVKVYNIDRGGDITYHGYGQLVIYPIFDLESLHIGLKQYVYNLEEIVIQLLSSYGIQSQRLEKAPGVWISDKQGLNPDKKICAIGIRSSRYVTMHGLALNVLTDLSYFSLINPCGFVDKSVTSMQQELGRELILNDVKERISNLFVKIFLNV